MKERAIVLSILAVSASLAASGVRASSVAAVAAGPQPAAVVTGNNFSFDVSGLNADGTANPLLTPREVSAFGATQTYSAAGINGQDITISSSESVDGGSTTDTFTVSTPVNFLTGTVNGSTITALQFDLGDANSGSVTVDVTLPIKMYSTVGSTVFGAASTTVGLTPGATLSNNNRSMAMMESVSAGGTDISLYAVHSFTASITYTSAAVPEPSPLPLAGGGLLSGVLLLLAGRRRGPVN